MGVLDDRGDLADRKAIVIGGGDGIGRAVVMALAQAGVDIAFCDIAEDAVPDTVAAVKASGRRVLGRVADAIVPAQLDAFYDEAGAFFDSVDLVVNVVGGAQIQPFMDRTPQACAGDIQRNYGYVIQSSRRAIPLLRKTGRGGSIINFTTIEAHRGGAGFAVYAGAKAATTNFSKALAVEFGCEGIRVNVVAPDTTSSAGNSAAMGPDIGKINADVPPEMWAEAFKMYIPLQTPPTSDDLANAVLFLASDLAKAITGQVMHVDGGTAAALGMIRWPHDEGLVLPVPMGPTLKKLFG